METKSWMSRVRKWSRSIHRDLSFFFSGVLLLYAVSGFMLNHKRDFNSDYSIERWSVQLQGEYPASVAEWDKATVVRHLEEIDQAGNYLKHYAPDENSVKVFIRGGSTLVVDLRTGQAEFESIHRRPLLSSLNRMHYNPSRWWTIFSDVFLVSLVTIVLSGLVMIKGRKGLWGRGGIELLAGILIPVLFIFLT